MTSREAVQPGPGGVGAALRRAGRAWLHLTDLPLHSLRRARALAGLRALAPAGSILFVCHGNVCRSPYAAAVFRQGGGLGPAVEVESAGFIGPGRSPPAEALALAGERGLNLESHRSKLLEGLDLQGFDLIVVMDREQGRQLRSRVPAERVLLLGDLDPRWGERREIADPWGRGSGTFIRVFDRIDRCVEVLRNGLR